MIYLSMIHVVGAALGGAVVGSLLAGIGFFLFLPLWRPIVIAIAVAFAVWQSLTRRPARLGLYWRQVPRSWHFTMRAEFCYFLWGGLLGSGIATVIPYSALFVLFATQLTSGITLGCLSGMLFGGTRQLVALLPLLKKQYRINPTSAGKLMPELAQIAATLNLLLTIIAGLLLVALSWH